MIMKITGKKIPSCILAFFILLLAFYVRATGLFDNFHTDEHAIMNPVETMSKNYSLDPDYYERPNHVSIYLNFIVQNAYSLARYHEPLANTYDGHVPEYFAVARCINAAIGTLMVVIAFLIGLEFSRRLANIFGLLFAFFPIFVDHSHLITPDIPSACLSLAMILIAIRIMKSFSRKRLIALCVFCALNILEKYPGLLSVALVIFVIAHHRIVEDGKLDLKKIIVECFKYGCLVILFCYLLSPSLFIHPKQTIKALLSESGGHLGADNLGFAGNLLFYAKTFGGHAGMLTSIFIVAWIVRTFKSRNPLFIPLYYGVFYWILMSMLKLHWVRWGLPMYLSPLFCIGLGIDYLLGARFLKIPVLAAFALVLVNGVVCSFFLTLDYHIPSTVNYSKQYALENGITPENAIYEGYTTFYEYRPGKDLDWFEKKDDSRYQFVILSSSMVNRYRNEPGRDPERVRAYDEIEKLELMRVFKASERPGISPFEYRNIREIPPYVLQVVKSGYTGYLKGPTLWFYKK